MSKLFTIEFSLGAALAIALYVLDKSNKSTSLLSMFLLACMAALIIHPTLSSSWIWSGSDTAMNVWRASATVCLILLAVSWFGIWTWPNPLGPTAPRAKVTIVDKRLILPTKEGEQVRIAYKLMNSGDGDGVFVCKDRTYYLSVDPRQTVFMYQPSAAIEIPLPAINKDARWDAEMRFDIQLTPEKMEALKTGKARLFFYAHCEYRDATVTYPIAFAEMYDAYFPGNLIAPPKEVLFEGPQSPAAPSPVPDVAELINWQRGDPNNPPRINFFRTVKGDQTELQFFVENPSQFPHYDISLRLWDIADMPDTPTGLEEIMKRSMVREIPSIAPSTVQIFGTFILKPADTSKKFGAQFTCRAGAYSEGINALRVNDKWTFARRMTTFDKEGKVMFLKIDDDYPKNPDGDIDW